MLQAWGRRGARDGMDDLKKAAGQLSSKAAFAAARDAAGRAIEDALSTDEERAGRKAEQAAIAKRKRIKWIVLGAVALLVLLGVIGMVLDYWQWFLVLGLVGLAGLYGRYRWRRYRSERRKPEASRVQADQGKLEPRERPAVAREASAAPDTSIEDELAALKARVKKGDAAD